MFVTAAHSAVTEDLKVKAREVWDSFDQDMIDRIDAFDKGIADKGLPW